MSIYVLIAWSFIGVGNVITTQEFNSLEACERARGWVVEQVNNISRLSRPTGWHSTAICVAKD